MAKRKPQTDDQVGYKKPPKHSQFKPGRSGNPGGRPKGSGSFAAAVRAQGNAIAPILLDGEPATLWEVTARSILVKAAQGDPKMAALLHKIDSATALAAPQKVGGLDDEYDYVVHMDFDEPPMVRPCKCQLEEIERLEAECYESLGLPKPD